MRTTNMKIAIFEKSGLLYLFPFFVLLGVAAGCENEKRYNEAYCGNGALDPDEECDGPSLGGETCISRGYTGGILACFSDCTFDDRQCTGGCSDACTEGVSRCNGSQNAVEQCVRGPRGCTEWMQTACTGETPYCVVKEGSARCSETPCVVDCTIDEKRCSSDGRARQICVLGEDNCPSWDSSLCPDQTPVCHLDDGIFSCQEF